MDELPAEIESWIGQKRYEEEGEFDVERGYFYNSLASVENGNPLFWDDAVAEELTGGPIAPPTLLSAWFRPHWWAPGRTQQAQPLQIHFDLKKKLDLPEAVMTDNTMTFYEPVRPGSGVMRYRYTRVVRLSFRPLMIRVKLCSLPPYGPLIVRPSTARPPGWFTPLG